MKDLRLKTDRKTIFRMYSYLNRENDQMLKYDDFAMLCQEGSRDQFDTQRIRQIVKSCGGLDSK